MAKETYPIPKSNPNAHMSITFLLLWAVNAVIIYAANMIFPQQIVLGAISASPMIALGLSSAILAWFETLLMPVFVTIEIKKQMVLAPQHWMIGYLIINFVSVWGVGRLADVIGLGFASWVYVLGLAVVLDIVQGMTMMLYGSLQQKNK